MNTLLKGKRVTGIQAGEGVSEGGEAEEIDGNRVWPPEEEKGEKWEENINY